MKTPIFATDEDIALRASHDYFLLCPADQVVARGSDGRFQASNRWVLSAPTVDFQAQGAKAGQVVLLSRPGSAFKPPGEALIVERAEGSRLTLRRKGQASGLGQPPSPEEGLVGVEFSIATFSPQIESAVADLFRRLGIDPETPDVGASSLSGELRDAVVLTVLHRRYLEIGRDAEPARDQTASKATRIKAELDESLARLTIHRGSTLGSDAVGLFRKRLVR